LAIAEGEFESRLKNAFGQVLAEEHALLSVAGSLEASRKSLSEAQLRFNLGQKTKLDVLRAEADLSALESRRLTTFEKRAGAVNALAELANMDRAEVTALGLVSEKIPSDETLRARELALREGIEALTRTDDFLQKLTPFLSPEEDAAAVSAIEKRLSEDHPRVELIKAEEELNLIRAASAWASEWPQLSLQASLNKQAENWDEAISPGERSYSVQLGLTIPLFSFGSSISRFRERNALVDAGETQARASALELRNSIVNDRTRILTLIQAEKAQKIAIRQNEELTELSFKSYQLGRATILELLSAQNAAMEARTQWVRTRVQLAALIGNFAWNLLGSTETELR
jgi:outer membrane protein TolC